MRVRLTRAARSEVQAVYDRLASESPLARNRFEERLSRILRHLRDFPEAGRLTEIPNLRVSNTNPYPYLIFYRIGVSEIVIIRVLHGARNPKSMPARPR